MKKIRNYISFIIKDDNMTANEENEEKITEGIIIDVDYGFGMKYMDQNNLYLKIEIQMFDGYRCIQLFNQEKIPKLLLQFKSDYITENSFKTCLMHRKVYLLDSDRTNSIPNAIANMPPNLYPQYEWIRNNNWD